MITLIAVTLTLIALLLIYIAVYLTLAWQKVKVYLTWNTRYETAEYEQAIITPKLKKPTLRPSKTEQRGRAIVNQDDLVDLADLDFETAAKAIEEAGQ